VFKSTDGATTWTLTSLPDFAVGALAINPDNPATLYAAGLSASIANIFKSIDGGDTWVSVNTGLPPYDLWLLTIDPETPTTLYTAGGPNLFKSTNAGATWGVTSPAGNGVLALAIDPITPQTLYAGRFDGVFKSTTGGSTWAAMNAGLPDGDIAMLIIDPTKPTTLYAATGRVGGGAFKSTDGAATWHATGLRAASYCVATGSSRVTASASTSWLRAASSATTATGSMATAATRTAPDRLRQWHRQRGGAVRGRQPDRRRRLLLCVHD